MADTLREVAAGLWVSDIGSAMRLRADFALVVDCTGSTPPAPNVLHARPSGLTGHSWTDADLEAVVAAALPVIEGGGRVLVHCNQGVSRSSTAAAAVVLAGGRAPDVDAALLMTAFPGQRPALQAVGGLQRWWAGRVG